MYSNIQDQVSDSIKTFQQMNSCETLPLHPNGEKHFVEETSAVGR
jgi:hypothetical protein